MKQNLETIPYITKTPYETLVFQIVPVFFSSKSLCFIDIFCMNGHSRVKVEIDVLLSDFYFSSGKTSGKKCLK